MDDCGKRWEGWRFAPRFDPSFGVGYHSCLWDCEEGFHEAFQSKKNIFIYIRFDIVYYAKDKCNKSQAEINLEISLVDRKSSV